MGSVAFGCVQQPDGVCALARFVERVRVWVETYECPKVSNRKRGRDVRAPAGLGGVAGRAVDHRKRVRPLVLNIDGLSRRIDERLTGTASYARSVGRVAATGVVGAVAP